MWSNCFWYLLAWKSLLAAYFPLRKVRWFPVWGAWQSIEHYLVVEPTLVGNGSLNTTLNDPLPFRIHTYFSLLTSGWGKVIWIHLWVSLFCPTLSGNHTGWRMVLWNISLNLLISPQFGNHCHWFQDGSPYICEPSYSPLQSDIHLWLKDDSIWISVVEPEPEPQEP